MNLSFEKKLVLFFLALATGVIVICVLIYYDTREDDKYTREVAAVYQKLISLEKKYLNNRDTTLLADIHSEIEKERVLQEIIESDRTTTEGWFYRTYMGLLLGAVVFIAVSFVVIRNQFLFRKRTEAEIRTLRDELEKRYFLVMDNMQEGIQILSREWRYLYTNKAVIEQSHSLPGELVGHVIMEKYPGIEQTELFTTMNAVMHDRQARRMDNEFRYSDGSIGYFELSIEPVQEGILILSTDISVRRKREEERDAYLRQLKEILFRISHEVRHPVARILSIANHLEHTDAPDQPADPMIDSMKKSAKELDGYVRELTAFVSSLKN